MSSSTSTLTHDWSIAIGDDAIKDGHADRNAGSTPSWSIISAHRDGVGRRGVWGSIADVISGLQINGAPLTPGSTIDAACDLSHDPPSEILLSAGSLKPVVN